MSTRKITTMLAASAALVAVASLPALADEPHYSNCTEAREQGAAPIKRDEPGYRPALDRNDDGVACEDSDSTGSGGSIDRPADMNETNRNEADKNEQRPSQQASPAGSDTDKEEAPSPEPVESDLPVTH